MIEIDGKLLNPAFIMSAEVETRFYINWSSTHLVIKMNDGSIIRKEHGWGFDAWKTLDKIKEVM